MARKKFSQEDYSFGLEAEKRVVNWLIDIGYEASKPDDVFAHDVTYAKGNEEPFSIEVERRYKWVNGSFPFSTINIPERRWKKLKTSHFMVVCKDMSVSYLVYTSEVLKAFREDGFDVATNIYCRNERFIQVARGRCLFLDLENITPRSVDRMKHCYLWKGN